MDRREAIESVLAANPHRLILSAPMKGQEKFRRANVRRMGDGWQVERMTPTQAFHQNLIDKTSLIEELSRMLEEEFTQLASFGDEKGYALRITKKGRALLTSTPGQISEKSINSHDRLKQTLLQEGTLVPALVDMGIFTQDGKLVQAKAAKFRQINRFVELVDHGLTGELPERLRVIDFGCGKSYLTFLLYHYLTAVRRVNVDMVGLDLKEDVVADCNRAAARYGYTNLHFKVGDIADYHSANPVDMVVTLHACDTATDMALANAVGWGARWIFSVPCCQHELNGQIQSEELSILTRYGIVKERTSALMTDAIRANLLTACGYKTSLGEFVDMEHTPKNILLRAVKGSLPTARRKTAMEEVERMCTAFSLDPCLLRLLRERNLLENMPNK